MSLDNGWFSRLIASRRYLLLPTHFQSRPFTPSKDCTRGTASRSSCPRAICQCLPAGADYHSYTLLGRSCHVVLDRSGSPLVQTRCEMRALCGGQHRHWVASG